MGGGCQRVWGTPWGSAWWGEAAALLRGLPPRSVDLIITGPPRGVGDPGPDTEAWHATVEAAEVALSAEGSMWVWCLGGWVPGVPARRLAPWRVLAHLVERGWWLCQEHAVWNPSGWPRPMEWVARRPWRCRPITAWVWWVARTPWPVADTRTAGPPHRRATLRRMRLGRPTAVPAAVWPIAMTASRARYLARTPGTDRPEGRMDLAVIRAWVRMSSRPGGLVVDPYAGSGVVGWAAELEGRRWLLGDRDGRRLAAARAWWPQPPPWEGPPDPGPFPSDSPGVGS